MAKVLANLFHLMEANFSSSIVDGFKDLLENKHLYQSVNIKFPSFEVAYKKVSEIPNLKKTQPDALAECQHIYNSLPEFGWRINSPKTTNYMALGSGGIPNKRDVEIEFTPTTIKIFCPTCDRIEPHNFYYGIDFFRPIREPYDELPNDFQVFLLSYECQSCKNTPPVFVVRREKVKITLSGRVPMEQVVVSKIIPKNQKKFFSDAIIAYNSGQILAGKFLLRTFIEQYVREVTENKTSRDIDVLLEKYAEVLPKDFRDRFPSLADIYSRLSVDVHKADSTPELFVECQLLIEEHFEAKKVFKLS